ncbi:hypothetical protein FQR65_LT09163 [Abscondita terminalis]|nr:hypothetical protein FQR65_LT09163 [Abscondita terminalis]
MERSWTVVKFIEDDSVQAVPTKWLIKNNKCYWPPYSQDRLIQAIKKCEPHIDNWPMYEVQMFRNSTYGDYQVARQKERKAEIESDLNTDTDGGNKRKRKQRVYSSDDDDEEIGSILSRPPQLNKDKELSTIRSTSLSTSSSIAASDVNSKSEEGTLCGSLNSTPTLPNSDVCSGAYSGTVISPMPSTSKQDDLILGFLRQVIRKQNVIQATLLQLVNDVNEIKSSSDKTFVDVNDESSIFLMFDFPLKDEANILKLEQYLENETHMNNMIQELSRIGGCHGQDFVKRVMSKILSNEVASGYSWLGLKKKKIFSKLLLSQVVIQAGLKVLKNDTQKSIEDCLKTWLRRATERIPKNNHN